MADIVAVYNGYTIPNLFDKFFFSKSYTNAVFSCTFLILSDTESNFVIACNEAENKLRERYASFSLKFGNTDEYLFSHVANTGFLQNASLQKITNELSTARSRAYKFSLEIDLPADKSGYNFRQEGSISFEQSVQQRKIVSVSGKYTASPDSGSGAKTALQNYQNFGIVWANSLATTLLGSYELLHSSYSFEQENKIINFSHRYQEKLALSVVYNEYSIPTSYNNFTITESYNTLSFSCEFAVAHENASQAETDLRIKNKDLTISFGGSPQYSYKHSDNTGFLAQPSLTLISNTTQDDTLRFYKFYLVCQRPANSSGYGYRRDGNFSIRYAATRRRVVNFTMTYTAGENNTALANYQAGGKVWASGILTAIGGAFELISEDIREEMEEKLCDASLSYQEILAKESEQNLDESAIVLAHCDYNVNLEQEYGLSESFATIAPVLISVNYAAQISRDVILLDTDLNAVYVNTVRPWIIRHAYNVLGLNKFQQAGSLSNYVAQRENYRINPYTYAVSGSITFLAPRSTNQILQLSETITTQRNMGITYQKIWDGIPHTYNIYSIGEQLLVRRAVQILQLESIPAEPPPPGADYILLNSQVSIQKKRVGAGSGSVLQERTLYIVNYLHNFLFAFGAGIQ